MATQNPDEKKSLADIGDLVNRLANRRLQSGMSGLPDEFVDSLAASTTAIDQSLPPEGPARAEFLANLQRDLEIKDKFSTESFGLRGGFAAIVNVSVETTRNGQTVNGLYVRCNPIAYGSKEPPLFPFNSASSPTSRKLPPGRFMLWVENADHQRVTLQPVDIGENGKDSETIRIEIP